MSFLRTPPGIALASLACAACGVIVVASYAPRRPPLAAPAALVVLSALLLALAAARNARGGLPRNVAGPVLAAATVAIAFLELVFVYDGMRGAPLALLTAALCVVALDLPLLIAGTAAEAGSAVGEAAGARPVDRPPTAAGGVYE